MSLPMEKLRGRFSNSGLAAFLAGALGLVESGAEGIFFPLLAYTCRLAMILDGWMDGWQEKWSRLMSYHFDLTNRVYPGIRF